MAMISPIELQKRIQQAIRVLPDMVKEELEKADLVGINKENLLQGKDSYGNDMPKYRNDEYAHFKTSINPRNRGFWDLRVMGEYHRWINVNININPAVIFFNNNLQNEKAVWLKERLGKRHLGITEEQLEEIQMNNKPIIREKILKIINGV